MCSTGQCAHGSYVWAPKCTSHHRWLPSAGPNSLLWCGAVCCLISPSRTHRREWHTLHRLSPIQTTSNMLGSCHPTSWLFRHATATAAAFCCFLSCLLEATFWFGGAPFLCRVYHAKLLLGDRLYFPYVGTTHAYRFAPLPTLRSWSLPVPVCAHALCTG